MINRPGHTYFVPLLLLAAACGDGSSTPAAAIPGPARAAEASPSTAPQAVPVKLAPGEALLDGLQLTWKVGGGSVTVAAILRDGGDELVIRSYSSVGVTDIARPPWGDDNKLELIAGGAAVLFQGSSVVGRLPEVGAIDEFDLIRIDWDAAAGRPVAGPTWSCNEKEIDRSCNPPAWASKDAAAVAVPDVPVPPAVEQQVLSTLEDWVTAQNSGKVDTYLGFYDPLRFSGVKRTRGGSVTALDFARWKTERTAMFRGAGGATLLVAADQPRVTGWDQDGGEVVVRFLQRWRVGRYSDHGAKEIRFRLEAAGSLRIVREEMLDSAPGWSEQEERDLGPLGVKARIRLPANTLAARSQTSDALGDAPQTSVLVHQLDKDWMVEIHRPADPAHATRAHWIAEASRGEEGETGEPAPFDDQRPADGFEYGWVSSSHGSDDLCHNVVVWKESLGLICQSSGDCLDRALAGEALATCRSLRGR